MNGFRVALQFLTALPIEAKAATAREIATPAYFYPIVGLAVGGSAVLLRHVLALVFPISFSIVAILAFLMWITGGLHEDGLADVADGMAGGWNREQRLSIMKDSHIGAFGALILAVTLLAKYAALTSMSAGRLDSAILTAQVLGRWSFLPLGYFNPYAREGLGSEFMKGIRANTVIFTTVFSSAVVILMSRVRGTAALFVSCAVIAAASVYFRRRIGGVTGDCFGAAFNFVEVATYAVFLA